MLLMCFDKLNVRPIITPEYHGMGAPLMDFCNRLLSAFPIKEDRNNCFTVYTRRRRLLNQQKAICNSL